MTHLTYCANWSELHDSKCNPNCSLWQMFPNTHHQSKLIRIIEDWNYYYIQIMWKCASLFPCSKNDLVHDSISQLKTKQKTALNSFSPSFEQSREGNHQIGMFVTAWHPASSKAICRGGPSMNSALHNPHVFTLTPPPWQISEWAAASKNPHGLGLFTLTVQAETEFSPNLFSLFDIG